jgi:hypothetical protein
MKKLKFKEEEYMFNHDTLWKKTKKNVAKAKESIEENSGEAMDKAKELSGEAWDKAKETSARVWQKTKDLLGEEKSEEFHVYETKDKGRCSCSCMQPKHKD